MDNSPAERAAAPAGARRELELFFAALRFFTRLPVPAWVGHTPAQLNHAARYFPWVGLVVGAIGAASYLAARLVLPDSLAVLVAMAATVLATGAFHEDGLADAVDGLGGGYTRARTLEIMRDSRIGSFGATALVLAFGAKFWALLELPDAQVPWILLAAHAASRFASTTLIRSMVYVREDEGARAKPLAHRLDDGELAIAAAGGVLPLLLLPLQVALASALAAALATLCFARLLRRRLGGYTGDCLGAAQQLAELAFYFACVAAWTLS